MYSFSVLLLYCDDTASETLNCTKKEITIPQKPALTVVLTTRSLLLLGSDVEWIEADVDASIRRYRARFCRRSTC